MRSSPGCEARTEEAVLTRPAVPVRRFALPFAVLAIAVAAACTTQAPSDPGFDPSPAVRIWTESPDGVVSSPPVAEAAPIPAEPASASHETHPADTALFPPGLLAPDDPGARSAARADVSLASPYHPYSHQTIRSPDGRLTRLYWVRAGRGVQIETLIKAHTHAGDPAVAVVTRTDAVQVDPRPQTPAPAQSILSNVPPGIANVSDLIAVTSSDEVLLEVDQLMTALLTETPQVEIEARVVEIKYDDDVQTGANLRVRENNVNTTTLPNGSKKVFGRDDRSTLFKNFTSPFEPTAFLNGEPVGTLALAFFDSDTRYRAFLRAIQNTTNSRVLSEPKMAVLNGHRAIIDTGNKTPVLQPVINFVGSLQQVQVRFEDTGIKLIVTPYLLMDDMIQVDITAEVSFVSGFINSGADVLNPIISNRNASTVVNVRDGYTFAIGGLIATEDTDVVSKVPLLGDIPLIGYLFKSTEKKQTQSQVLFFITPRLIKTPASLLEPVEGSGG